MAQVDTQNVVLLYELAAAVWASKEADVLAYCTLLATEQQGQIFPRREEKARRGVWCC